MHAARTPSAAEEGAHTLPPSLSFVNIGEWAGGERERWSMCSPCTVFFQGKTGFFYFCKAKLTPAKSNFGRVFFLLLKAHHMTNSAIKATYLPTYRHFIVYEGEIIMGKRFGQQPALFFACLCGGLDVFLHCLGTVRLIFLSRAVPQLRWEKGPSTKK